MSERASARKTVSSDAATESPERRYMDVREFREAGFLQEVSRRVLHPVGLALEVAVEEDGTERLGGI
jgi:hypothetical protein